MPIKYCVDLTKRVGRKRHVVLDKNMFGRECFQQVKSYLESSTQNFLVVTDFLVRECMQGNAAHNFVSDFSKLVSFVDQLVVPKPTLPISRLSPRSEGLHNRLICHEQTADLRRGLSDTLHNIKSHGPTERFLKFANQSQCLFDELLGRANEMQAHLSVLIETFPRDELKAIRSRKNVTKQFAHHLLGQIAEFAVAMFPEGVPLPKMPHVLYSFPYRYALAYINLALDWRLNDGGIRNAKPEQIRNDSIDLTYVTYSTFFDGLLSQDKRMLRVSEETNQWLRVLLSAWQK